MRARNVISRGSKKFRVKFPSKKLNRGVHCESLLERDFVYFLELSPGVLSYQEQPEKVIYEHQLHTRTYYPDFKVQLKNGNLIHFEVKPFNKINTIRNLSKFDAIIRHYERQHREFRIVTDHRIRQKPLLNNLKELYKSLRGDHEISCERTQLLELLDSGRPFSVSSLVGSVGKIPVYRMLANYELVCDLTKCLNASDNYVRVAKENDLVSLLF